MNALKAKRNGYSSQTTDTDHANHNASRPQPARHTARPWGWPRAETPLRGGQAHTDSHAASGLHGRRGHRPPTWGEGVTEAKEEEEGSAGGMQVVGTRSWEAGAQGGRPGAGPVGTGEVPHITFSCSSVTYLGEGRTREGI